MRKARKAVAGVTAPAMTAALPLAGVQPAAGSPPGDPGPTVSDPSTVGPHELPNRLEDKHMWWSESGDDLENTMSRPVDLTAATTAARTLKARYEIDAGFDYLYVQASIDGGTTWTSLDGTAGGEPFVRTASQPAISGSSAGEWVDVNVPLDAYAGQAIELRFLYDTDGGVAPDGFFADEISVVADGTPLFTSGAEEGDEGWALDGFRATTGTETGVFDNYCIASHRSFIRGQNAQPVFDDSRPYWSPQIPQTGVKVPDSGTRIRVVSVDATSMRIGVSSR